MSEKLENTVKVALLFFITIAVEAFARDFRDSINTVQDNVRMVLLVLGPLSLMLAGGVFYFSRNTGLGMLQSALIGTIVFASSSTLFTFLYRAFN